MVKTENEKCSDCTRLDTYHGFFHHQQLVLVDDALELVLKAVSGSLKVGLIILVRFFIFQVQSMIAVQIIKDKIEKSVSRASQKRKERGLRPPTYRISRFTASSLLWNGD